MATSEAGQEKHNAQLGEFVEKVKQLEKEKQALQCRLDGVLADIQRAYSNIFEVEKSLDVERKY